MLHAAPFVMLGINSFSSIKSFFGKTLLVCTGAPEHAVAATDIHP